MKQAMLIEVPLSEDPTTDSSVHNTGSATNNVSAARRSIASRDEMAAGTPRGYALPGRHASIIIKL
jgi:hypothetical protein